MSKEFKRRDVKRYSKIGKNRKKLQRWKKPTGRDNKMRLKRHGYPSVVSVGYKTPKKESGLIDGKKPVLVHNTKELQLMEKNNVAILASVGAKKKLELIKKAQELGIKIINVKEGKKNETK